MPQDSKPDRLSKRKNRDGPDDAVPRKKLHRPASVDEDVQFKDYGNRGDEMPSKASHKVKSKQAVRNEKEYPSVNELKKRIRDVKRLLNKQDLSADARVLQERALAGYEEDLTEELVRRERSQMIKKYHFVRFLGMCCNSFSFMSLTVWLSDRKTATKQLNRLIRREKEQDLDDKQKGRFSRKIHDARVNLNYTIYYPLTEKYMSLYPKSNGKSDDAGAASASESDSKEQEKEHKGTKPPLWTIVEKCMEDGSLDALREGKLNVGSDGQMISGSGKTETASAEASKSKPEKKQTVQKDSRGVPQKDKRSSRHTESSSKRDKHSRRDGRERGRFENMPAEPQGDDSDGGFFEE